MHELIASARLTLTHHACNSAPATVHVPERILIRFVQNIAGSVLLFPTGVGCPTEHDGLPAPNLQTLNSELEKARNAERLKSVTPEAKAASDRRAWSQWLQRYGRRLAKEAAAGADPHERVRVQNSTNPR
eukprot:1153694-Pelagomonas_calceolata.AAC.1